MASRRVIENNELKAQIKALEERNKELEWGRMSLICEFQEHLSVIQADIMKNGHHFGVFAARCYNLMKDKKQSLESLK